MNAAEDGNSAEQQFPFLFSPPFTPICGWHFSLFYSKLPYSDTCMSSQKKSNIASPRDHSWFHPNIGKTNDGPADSICGSDLAKKINARFYIYGFLTPTAVGVGAPLSAHLRELVGVPASPANCPLSRSAPTRVEQAQAAQAYHHGRDQRKSRRARPRWPIKGFSPESPSKNHESQNFK